MMTLLAKQDRMYLEFIFTIEESAAGDKPIIPPTGPGVPQGCCHKQVSQVIIYG